MGIGIYFGYTYTADKMDDEEKYLTNIEHNLKSTTNIVYGDPYIIKAEFERKKWKK